MKKILTLCAGLLLVFGLSACDETGELPHPGEEEPDPEVTEPEPETGDDGGDTGDGGETQYVELELIKDSYTLTEGDDPVKLEYNVNPLESIVTVTSSNENTATVTQDDDGLWWITPVLAGYGESTLTVTASYEGYESDIRTATVTVIEGEIPSVVTGIRFAEDSYSLTVGEPKTFVYGEDVIIEGTGNHSTDFVLSVDADHSSVITISEDGHTVTASEAVENVTLTATATGSDVVGTVTGTTTISATSEVVEPAVTDIKFSAESYTVVYKQGEPGTLDLSNAVTVEGNETLNDKTFTISCEVSGYDSYFTISDNVITAKAPTTSDGIEIKATSNFDSTQVATSKVVVTDGTKYVEKIEFVGIDNGEVTLYTGNTDESHPNTRAVTASVTPTDAYETDYDIAVVDTSVAEWADGVLQAKSAGETTITATSKGITEYGGSAATVTATVKVEYVKKPVSTIKFSQSTYSTKESVPFTIGGADSGATIQVVDITEGVDDPTWSLSVSEGDEYITINEPVEGVYTVSPKTGSAGYTAKIKVTPTDPASADVYDVLTVTILADDYDVIYVDHFELSQTEMTVTEGEKESFTIGGTGSDVTVTVKPDNATNPAYTVSCNSDKITVTGSETSWTVNILSGAGGESTDGNTYEIVIASEDGHATSTLKLTVNRPEAVPTDWEVETTGELKIDNVPKAAAGEGPASLDLDTVVSVTIKDQYGETMTGEGLGGYTVTANTDNITVTDHVVYAASYTSETASVTLTSSDIENAANKAKTLSIRLSPKAYPVESITVNDSDSVTESVEWGGSTSVTVSVSPSYADNTGYSVTSNLESSNELFEVGKEDSTVTFTHKGVHAGTEVFTIKPKDGTDISCTVTLTAEKQVIEPGTPYFENLAGTYEHTYTFNDLESYLNYNWAEDEDGDHVHDSVTTEFTSSNTGVISISGSTATIEGTGSTTITATISADHLENDLTATAEITVIWTATELTISSQTLTLIEGDTETLSVSFGPSGYTTTPTVNWEVTSGSQYVTISSTIGDSITVTAESAGTAVITASAEGCASVTCDVTVTAAPKFESYTFTLTLYKTDGTTAFPAPTGNYGVYINTSYEQDQWENWGTHEMDYDSSTHTYSWTTTNLPSSYASEPYYATIYAGEDAGEPSWSHALKENIALSVTSSSTGAISDSASITMSCDSWEALFPHGTTEETFYVVMIDASSRSSNMSGSLTFYTDSLSCWLSGSTGTQTRTASQGQTTSKWAVYSGAGTARAGDSDYFQVQYNTAAHMSTNTVEIPSDSSGTPVYLAGGWFSDDWTKAGSSDWWDAKGSNGDCYWDYMGSGQTIASYVSSLVY